MARDHRPSLRHFRRRSRAVAATAAAIAIGGTVLTEVPVSAAGEPRGHDVSSHQKDVDWQSAKAKGATFVYIKATESHTYRSPYFGRQYDGSRAAGLIRGAYHFALPDRSSGITQARYFVRNGGAWRADGWTLPPALDVEYNPYGKKKCYGLDKAEMASWITAFSNEVARLTGRRPVIYTTAHWWNTCTNSSSAFTSKHALWLARYNASDAGALPSGGWKFWTFWQYDNSGSLPGDQNLFNGTSAQLKRFAKG
ncbi:lysozyme [Streptomyces sp. NBC_01451]|uniref:lysozyme n=1 Tax=Streptomyces sp. NBC_01451 TaxID=2903872 RepID=UPI002E35A031|nr:lysozyme [Streptomyces sp. NBC_01451]